MLRERFDGRRIIFTDAERLQLAEKARALGRKALHEPAPWSRLRHCFAGARSWWHGSGRSWKDAVLVEGLGNVIIMPRASYAYQDAPVIRRARLGGLLNYYERAAA